MVLVAVGQHWPVVVLQAVRPAAVHCELEVHSFVHTTPAPAAEVADSR